MLKVLIPVDGSDNSLRVCSISCLIRSVAGEDSGAGV